MHPVFATYRFHLFITDYHFELIKLKCHPFFFTHSKSKSSRGNINISETFQKFLFFPLRFNRSKQVIPFPSISHKFYLFSPVQINRNDFDLLNQGGETNDFYLLEIDVS